MSIQPPPLQIPIFNDQNSMDVSWSQWFTSLTTEGLSSRPEIQSKTLASSTLTFTSGLNKTYKRYHISLINLRLSSPTGKLYVQMASDGGTDYINSSGSYDWMLLSYTGDNATDTVGDSHTTDYNDTSVPLTNVSPGNGSFNTVNGYVELIDPSSDTKYTTIKWDLMYYDTNNELTRDLGQAQVKTISALDAIKIYPDDGNISSGTATLYGLR